MKSVPIHDLKRNLAATIELAASGERIVVTRHDKPVAVLISASNERIRVGARFGQARLAPLFKRATKGRYLEVLDDDRRSGEPG
ncbi:MAG: type II toxin-antitoxin system Phd/YefM family antitoxin [Deltaproteobacteria bacterium]|nr:type II toxin-antitoxin system Phd/YefM family antitoxin [Deltaproteobacteria bacterium]